MGKSATFFMAVTLATPLYAGQYDGKYRPDHDWASGWDCETTAMDGGAIEFTGDKLWEVESLCTLSNPTQIRDMNATLYDADCANEGESFKQRLLVMATKAGVAIIRDGGSVYFLRRCE